MVLELVLTALAGYVLGVVASRFATLTGIVLFVLWLLGQAVPSGLLERSVEVVGYFVAPGTELLFVAALLVGVGSARTVKGE